MSKELPRDTVINELYEAAKKNKDIYFLCCDLGALALDRFRADLPNQYIHTGISEQNTIDLAAGLAMSGKTVYVYGMGCFITTRCLEQIKVTFAAMNLPVTMIGVGVGYGYDDAGPTHYPIDDITCMRSLGNIEIVTPADRWSALVAARESYTQPRFRYIRLDRVHLPDVYAENDTRFQKDGIVEIEKGKDICIVTNGFLIQKAKEARRILADEGIQVGVIDAYRLKPLDHKTVVSVFAPYKSVVTAEEHFLSGGLGSTLLEAFADTGAMKRVRRLGINDVYRFENGKRPLLQQLDGIDTPSLCNAVRQLTKESHSSTSVSTHATNFLR